MIMIGLAFEPANKKEMVSTYDKLPMFPRGLGLLTP